jgi:hypothetical protein
VKNAVAAGRRLLQSIDDAVLYSDVFPREIVISHALLQQKRASRKRSAKEALVGGGGRSGGKKRDRSDSMAASEVSVGAGELEQGSALALLKMNNQLGEGGDEELDENEAEDGDFEDGLEENDDGDEVEDFNDYAQDNNDDYEGGELWFPYLNLKFKAQKGDIIFFPSTFMEVFLGERKAVWSTALFSV